MTDALADLGQILEEFDGHVEECVVLGDARLEASVDAHQFADDLISLSLRVTLHSKHLCSLQQTFHFILRFLTDAQHIRRE